MPIYFQYYFVLYISTYFGWGLSLDDTFSTLIQCPYGVSLFNFLRLAQKYDSIIHLISDSGGWFGYMNDDSSLATHHSNSDF